MTSLSPSPTGPAPASPAAVFPFAPSHHGAGEGAPGPRAPVRNTLTIREFPESERPRERLRRYGPNSLSNGELIAILFRTGLEGENVLALGTRVLAEAGGLSGLARVSYDELCEKKGVSEAKACQLLAALELGKRVASLSPDDRPVVRTAGDIAQLLIAEMSVLERERFRVVLLNSKNQVVGIEELYSGSVDTAVVRPAEVFASAVRKTCVAIAVVHNHPSGDPTPSQEDIQITRRLAEAGRSLDIELVDHLIIGQGRWVSLRERGLGSIGARTPEGPH